MFLDLFIYIYNNTLTETELFPERYGRTNVVDLFRYIITVTELFPERYWRTNVVGLV